VQKSKINVCQKAIVSTLGALSLFVKMLFKFWILKKLNILFIDSLRACSRTAS